MMTGRLRTSRAGLELIKSFEGFRENAVRLPDGQWMIGYGHVRTAREGLTITETDAEDLLVYDLRPIEDAIQTSVFAPLNQNQHDALVSLTLSISPAQFRDSDILRLLNGGDFLSAASGFDHWRKARIHGRLMVVDALVRRRAAEKAMFLEHPDGRPAAPTPLVRSELDTSSGEIPLRPRADEPVGEEASAQPEPADDDQDGRSPSIDIAEAVRRLAERANDMVTSPPQPVSHSRVENRAAPPRQPADAPATKSPEDIRREVAERVARILERTERAIAEQQSPQPESQAPPRAEVRVTPPPAAPRVTPASAPKKPEREIPEDLPDFDAPVSHPSATAASNGRTMIDDTETFDPGRDPAEMFAEAERKAKIVNGRTQTLGPLNGRMAVLLPWIVILVLSVLGFGNGLVSAFKDSTGPEGGSSMMLALFGVLMVMSAYFLLTRSSENGI